ncbi:MAG: Ig-like domain-containing protein [Ruminococcus sp.]|nr:Ig-like domain-containing protein [Ruminococcus sp.]
MTITKRFISVLLCLTVLLGCAVSVFAYDSSGYSLFSVLNLKVGETIQLTAKDASGNYVNKWKSDNPKVASITPDGKVTALSVGEAVMSIKVGESLIGRLIKVEKSNVKLNKTKLSLYVGGKATLTLSDTFSAVKWKSKNTKIATVTSKGVVKAKKAGKAKITATYNKKTYSCTVTVNDKPVSINKTKATLTAGKKLTLKLTNATASKVKWSSSNKKVATVTSKGVVKAVKKGTATITAKYKNKKYKCKITVKAKVLTVGQAMDKLKAYVIKNGKAEKSGGKVTDYVIEWKKGTCQYALLWWLDEKAFVIHVNDTSVTDKNKPWMLKMDLYRSSSAIKNVDISSTNPFSLDYSLDGYATIKRAAYKKSKDVDFTISEYDGKTKTVTKDAFEKAVNTLLRKTFPEWNTYISKKAGVTMKQLGFANWDK